MSALKVRIVLIAADLWTVVEVKAPDKGSKVTFFDRWLLNKRP